MPRFTIDMDDQFNDTLTRLANGSSKAEVIRKAVASYQYLKAQTADQKLGNKVSITNAEGVVQKDVILP